MKDLDLARLFKNTFPNALGEYFVTCKCWGSEKIHRHHRQVLKQSGDPITSIFAQPYVLQRRRTSRLSSQEYVGPERPRVYGTH